jgi:outer membrane protein TolC
MKKNIFIIIIVLIISGKIFSLTLDNAINIGLRNSSVLKASEEGLTQAKWDYYQSNFNLLPSASFSGGYQMYDPKIYGGFDAAMQQLYVEDSQSYGFSASMPLFVGGKVWQNARIKKASYAIAEHTHKNNRLKLISDIENKFFVCLEAKQMNEIAEKEYSNALILEELTDVRYRNGQMVEAELLRMKSLSGQRKVRVLQTQTNYLTAVLDLKTLLSIDDQIEVEDTDNKESSVENDLNIENWDIAKIELFLQEISSASNDKNLDIQITKKSVDISKKALIIAGGNFLPSINVSYQKQFQKTNLDNDYKESGSLMLGASIPIFPIADNVSNYIKNKSSVRKSEYDLINAENNVSLVIRSAALNWISASQSMESARMSLDYAGRSWDMMNQRYINGIITNTEMLDADIMLSNASLQYTKSKFDILRSRSFLKQLLNIESNIDFISFIERIIQ